VSTQDDDILDFEFFDEGATREDSPTREPRGGERRPERRERGGGPRPPRFRGTGGWTPLLRLVGLIALAILIVVVLVVWAQGCASDHERSAYKSYMTEMSSVGSDSAQIGQSLATLLTTAGLKQADLLSQLGGLIQRQQQDVTRAEKLDPPGPVRAENDHAIDALQLRVSGMQGLSNVFKKTAKSKDAVQSGNLLAAQARRLLASDVVWSDLFQLPAQRELQSRDVTGVAVPPSVFVTDPELYSAKSLTLVWRRVHGASLGGSPSGLHGTNIESVVVNPGNTTLSTSTETTVHISTDLEFVVNVHNGGSSQEVQIQVTLTIPTQPNSIVKTGTIPVIDPGDTKPVTFKDFSTLPPGEPLKVRVDVKPVKGEQTTTNNTAEYPILTTI
jgi:CARDB